MHGFIPISLFQCPSVSCQQQSSLAVLYMQYHTTCSLALSAVPHAVQYHMQRVTWYHLQHGTEWRAVPHAAWYCMESRTTCSMVLHGEPYHMQHGTAWRAVPHAAWYCMESPTTCSMVLHGEPYHTQHGSYCMESRTTYGVPFLSKLDFRSPVFSQPTGI